MKNSQKIPEEAQKVVKVNPSDAHNFEVNITTLM
jgi:hypothetical protein